MNIGIDFRLANSSHRGMAKYCLELTNALIRTDSRNNYFLFIDREPSNEMPDNVRYIKLPVCNYILGEQLFLPYYAEKLHCDVLWCPNNTFPILLSKKIKLIVTIHDLIFLNKSNNGTESLRQRIGRIYRALVLKRFKHRINRCLTVSEFSKSDIKNSLGLSCPIDITSNSIREFQNKTNQFVNSNPEISKQDFFFTVSGDAPSKNLRALIDLFNTDFVTENLVIAGVPSDSKLRSLGNQRIHFLEEGIDENELIRYYLRCKCFVFPSLKEGFGIPLLEAMSANAPIIASNVCSIPEILKDKGILSEPTSAGLKSAIRSYLNGEYDSAIFDYTNTLEKYTDISSSLQALKNTIFN